MSEIVEHISRDRPEAARQWAEGVFDAVDRLPDFPDQGRIVPEVGRPEVRELLYGEYRVLYKVEAKSIGVLTVRHGRRRFDPDEVESDR